MKNYCLVTTADEATWPNNKPVVFIGEWCKRHSRMNSWASLDSITVPYHWDNREQLKKDYIYLENIYEDLLAELKDQLNSIHQTSHSLRYWRILIGPWLGIFVQIIFDRWKMLKLSLDEYEVDSCNVHPEDVENFIPQDTHSFINFVVSDSWNEMIYSHLLRLIPNKLDVNELTPMHKQTNLKRSFKSQFKKSLKTGSNYLGMPANYFDNIFIYKSGFPVLKDIQLQLKFKQFPQNWASFSTPEVLLNLEMREWDFKSKINNCDFSSIVCKLIPKCIPRTYLEGYNLLVKNQKKLPWPKTPKVIFTSEAYFTDDVFKAWAASKVCLGSSLVIGQHGGNFGMTPMSFLEEHQIKISDKFLSWGWTDNSEDKIIPVGNLKSQKNTKNFDPKGHALFVEYALPRFSYQIYSVPIASQWLDYFKEQSHFVGSLPSTIQNNLIIRLKADFGWDQKNRWDDLFPNIIIDSGEKSMKEMAVKSRIFISTYNATTYLESLAWNIPTIIFWKPEHWELNDNASKYFDILESVGIFHKTPESAAQKLTEVWDNIELWWEKNETQIARKSFVRQYSLISESSSYKMQKVLNNLIKK